MDILWKHLLFYINGLPSQIYFHSFKGNRSSKEFSHFTMQRLSSIRLSFIRKCSFRYELFKIYFKNMSSWNTEITILNKDKGIFKYLSHRFPRVFFGLRARTRTKLMLTKRYDLCGLEHQNYVSFLTCSSMDNYWISHEVSFGGSDNTFVLFVCLIIIFILLLLSLVFPWEFTVLSVKGLCALYFDYLMYVTDPL